MNLHLRPCDRTGVGTSLRTENHTGVCDARVGYTVSSLQDFVLADVLCTQARTASVPQGGWLGGRNARRTDQLRLAARLKRFPRSALRNGNFEYIEIR